MVALGLPIPMPVAARLDGTPMLLFLDIDGTVASIAPRPEDAVVSPAMRQVIGELARLPETHVVAISGRAADDARRVVGLDDVWVVGNHGIEVGEPHRAARARDDVAAYESRIADAVKRCREIAKSMAGVIVEDKRFSASVHYRLADPSIVPSLSSQVATIARENGLRLTYGRRVLELRPPVDIDKGTAAIALAKQLGALEAGSSILCAGDDRTDEDAFRALRSARPQSITIRVGGEPGLQTETTAEFSLPNVDAVRELLVAILARRTESVRS